MAGWKPVALENKILQAFFDITVFCYALHFLPARKKANFVSTHFYIHLAMLKYSDLKQCMTIFIQLKN